jgi:hypothetical protein
LRKIKYRTVLSAYPDCEVVGPEFPSLGTPAARLAEEHHMVKMSAGDWGLHAVAAGAVVFGILTIIAGGRALFGGLEARAEVGNAVPFVLWFNFGAGFVYVLSGAGLFARRKWAAWLAGLILLATLGVFGAFGFHVLQGWAYEMRTVGAMIVRTVVWAIITAVAWRTVLAVNPGTQPWHRQAHP